MTDLETRFIKSLLRPGDIILYDGDGIFAKIIKFKRGEQYCHVEVYIGGERSVASRDGVGVNEYPLRLDGIAAIYRSVTVPDIESGMTWFETVKGQDYDWIGLLSFAWAKYRGLNNNKMFCSEFATRFLRACGVEPFNADCDADCVSPEMLTYSHEEKPIWVRSDKRKE